MKQIGLLFVILAAFLLTVTSCGNRNAGNNSDETSSASVEAQKCAIADSILVLFDSYAKEYGDIPQSEMAVDFKLSDKEKLVKPTYLLDPEIASTMVTKQQKINALAILLVETQVRKAYDLPTDKSSEAIIKLSTELNTPIDLEDAMNFDIPASEKARTIYQTCKERGDLSYFWRFNFALVTEMEYIIANNPDIFFKNVSEENLAFYAERNKSLSAGIRQLAKYDSEMNQLNEFIMSNMVAHNLAVDNQMFRNKEMARQSFKDYKEYFCDIRNNLIF